MKNLAGGDDERVISGGGGRGAPKSDCVRGATPLRSEGRVHLGSGSASQVTLNEIFRIIDGWSLHLSQRKRSSFLGGRG